ncbi:hypothetical protein FQ087_21025 [Sporosarcina sp. ANT_H38]|uniref:hypothetical protein n=1 Tax=Sporosarcina sp. ANT_H38 TaxID=2597358 RepID=UPI0011F2E5EB|nr:hypothetical protein [Sporosarcina sp. ANT_H38]KAA0941639.1 hypothetical protein FQ087_21025 [Sporosarcina sp. ANT_H38]
MIELLSRCEREGNSLSLEGDGIRVENIAQLPANLKNEITANKNELIKALNRDLLAIENCILIGIPGTLYTWTVSRFTFAYVEYVDGEWIATRETYKPGVRTATSHKVIAKGNTFEYVFNEFVGYKNFITSNKK